MLEMGSNPNIKDSNGWTALHYACQLGDLECVKILLSHNAEINSYSNHKKTPLHLACYNGYTNIVQYLIAYRPDEKSNIKLEKANLIMDQTMLDLQKVEPGSRNEQFHLDKLERYKNLIITLHKQIEINQKLSIQENQNNENKSEKDQTDIIGEIVLDSEQGSEVNENESNSLGADEDDENEENENRSFEDDDEDEENFNSEEISKFDSSFIREVDKVCNNSLFVSISSGDCLFQ